MLNGKKERNVVEKALVNNATQGNIPLRRMMWLWGRLQKRIALECMTVEVQERLL